MQTMTWDSFQQLLRILIYSFGGYLFGDGVVQTELFQMAAGGLLSVGAFGWWWFWNKQRVATPQ